MSVQFVTDRLAAMWGEIEGIARAYPNIPRTLNSTDLPAVVIFPRELISRQANGSPLMVTEDRTYDMVLYIAQALLGDGDDAQIAAAPWFDTVPAHFLARPGLELDADTPQTRVTFQSVLGLDRGFANEQYPTGGQRMGVFAAIAFPIRVTHKYKVIMRD